MDHETPLEDHNATGESSMNRSLFKRPGSFTKLARAVVQLGTDPGADTLILLGKPSIRRKCRWKSIPLWSEDRDIAAEAGCSTRTVCRWRWALGIYKYGSDHYTKTVWNKGLRGIQVKRAA